MLSNIIIYLCAEMTVKAYNYYIGFSCIF